MSPLSDPDTNPMADYGPPVTLQLNAREFATLLDALQDHLHQLTNTPWPDHLKPPAKWEPYYPIWGWEHFQEYLPLPVHEVHLLYERLAAQQRGEEQPPALKEGEVIE